MSLIPAFLPANILRDNNGYPYQTSDVAFPFPSWTTSILLTQNVVSTITVNGPTTNVLLSIKYTEGVDVWVTADGSTPQIPVGEVDGTQQLNPHLRSATVYQQLQFLTGSATPTYVNISFYQINTL